MKRRPKRLSELATNKHIFHASKRGADLASEPLHERQCTLQRIHHAAKNRNQHREKHLRDRLGKILKRPLTPIDHARQRLTRSLSSTTKLRVQLTQDDLLRARRIAHSLHGLNGSFLAISESDTHAC